MTPEQHQSSESTGKLTHVDQTGAARMVDVGEKPVVRRVAIAEGLFCARASTIDALMQGEGPKGEALGTARIAGIMAAKKTDDLIPLCHSLPLDAVNIEFERVRTGEEDSGAIRIRAEVSTSAKTGVEMEALTAVSIAALTLYDMAKAIDKGISIEGVRLVSKTKG